MVKNYMEDIVELLIPNIINDYSGVCKCPACVEDIKAITLNNLKPYYVATERGHVYTKVNELVIQFRTDVITEAVKAIEKVMKNPRH